MVTSAAECHRVFERLVREKDIDALTLRFSDNAVLVGEGRRRAVGRAEIRKEMQAMISLIEDIEFKIIDIIENGDVALERLIGTVRLRLPSGEEQVLVSESNVVLRKQPDGNWLTVIDDAGM